MGFMLYTIHIVVSLFLILVVLLQQGKGADLSVFGGGGTMTAFGARGAASVLHRLTVGGFVVFIVTTLAIGVYQTKAGDKVLSTLPAVEESEAETPDTGLSGVLPEAESFDSEGEGEATEDDGATDGGATTDGATPDSATPDTATPDTATPEASAAESGGSNN